MPAQTEQDMTVARVEVPTDLWIEIRARALRSRQTVSQIVAAALRDYLART